MERFAIERICAGKKNLHVLQYRTTVYDLRPKIPLLITDHRIAVHFFSSYHILELLNFHMFAHHSKGVFWSHRYLVSAVRSNFAVQY